MMDQLDRTLLTLLRHDGRRSISDLADALDVSRATVRSRIERMEQRGDIVGYTVVLRAEVQSAAVRGITLIAVEGRASARVIDQLASFPEVLAVHTTNGKWDIIAEVGAENLTALDAVLQRVRMIAGIVNSETNLFLATPRGARLRV